MIKKVLGFSLLGLLLALFIVGTVYLQSSQNKESTSSDFADSSKVTKICELATLKCYYHNVAEYKDQPALFKYGVFRYGYKKFFMEYNGIIKIGVDAGGIVIQPPTESNVVKVYVPEARILDIDADLDSLSMPVTDTGFFTSISAEEKATAFAEAQANMSESAGKDQVLLGQARENAKELIKQYVVNIGKMKNKDYTVKWLSDKEV